jgi:hypothetical protein
MEIDTLNIRGLQGLLAFRQTAISIAEYITGLGDAELLDKTQSTSRKNAILIMYPAMRKVNFPR